MTKNTKTLFKFFVIFFLVFLITANWREIALFFNYRIIEHKISEILTPEETIQNNNFTLYIPAIELEAPLKTERQEVENLLNKGTALHPDSVLPGEEGSIIILGHSAPQGWPDIDYDNVFNKLNDLKENDEIIIFSEEKDYSYKVVDKIIFFPEEEAEVLDNRKNSLILITCWPPGKDYKRMAVFAKQLDK